MAEYNLSEFRANTRKAFDEAERGEPVYIERHGEDFILISKKNWSNTVGNRAVPNVKSEGLTGYDSTPAKKNNSDPQADELPGVDSL